MSALLNVTPLLPEPTLESKALVALHGLRRGTVDIRDAWQALQACPAGNVRSQLAVELRERLEAMPVGVAVALVQGWRWR